MKKSIVLMCMLLACVMLLSSCDKIAELFEPAPETAEELWERIDQRMNEFDSYKLEQDMEMVIVVQGYTMTTTATGQLAEIGDPESGNYYYYSEVDATVTCDELDIEERSYSLSAYVDGKAYEITEQSGLKRNLYCKMKADEYLEYQKTESSMEDLDFTDCTTAEFAQNEDKTWTLTYSGYTKKAMDIVSESLGAQSDLFGAELQDMQIVFKADEEYCVSDIEISFIFDVEQDADPAPSLRIAMHLSEFGDVSRMEDDRLDPEKCTKVESLAVLKDIREGLDARKQAEQGSFSFTMTQQCRVGSITECFIEESEVEFAGAQGKFTYTANAVGTVEGKSGETHTTLSYENGVVSATVDGQTGAQPQTEEEARAYIANLIDDATYGYDADRVMKVKYLGTKNGWEIEQAVPSADCDAFKLIMDSIDATYQYTDQLVYARFAEDGSLTYIKVASVIYGTYSGKNITYSIIIEVEFH